MLFYAYIMWFFFMWSITCVSIGIWYLRDIGCSKWILHGPQLCIYTCILEHLHILRLKVWLYIQLEGRPFICLGVDPYILELNPCILELTNTCGICIMKYECTLSHKVWLNIRSLRSNCLVSRNWPPMYLKVSQYIWIFHDFSCF